MSRNRLPADVQPFDAHALLADGEEWVTTVVEAISSPRGDGEADISVRLYEETDDSLTLRILLTYHDSDERASLECAIKPADVLRLSRVIHRAAARAQRLGMFPPRDTTNAEA